MMAERPAEARPGTRPRRRVATVDFGEAMRKLEQGMKAATKVEKSRLRRELRPPEQFFALRRRRA